MSTENKNHKTMASLEKEEHKNKNNKVIKFSEVNQVKTYNPNNFTTSNIINPYAKVSKLGTVKKEIKMIEHTKMAKENAQKKQNKKQTQTKLAHPLDIKKPQPKQRISIKLEKNGSNAKPSHELFRTGRKNPKEVIDLTDISYNDIILPNFDKETVAKAFCKVAKIQDHIAVLSPVTYGKVLKILISFRNIENIKDPNFFKALKKIIQVCAEIDPNMRIVLINEGKYDSTSKITSAQFNEDKATTYVFDEKSKKHTNKVIFVRTCIPHLGRLLAVWIRHRSKHRIYPSNFLVLQTADVVLFVNADAKAVNIASLTVLVERELLPDIPFHIYDKEKWVKDKRGKLVKIRGLHLQTHIKDAEEARKRMLAGSNAILKNNYCNIKTAPITYDRNNKLQRERFEEHKTFMKCKQELVVKINSTCHFRLENVMTRMVNLVPSTVNYNLFPVVDIFQDFLVASHRSYDHNIALQEFTQIAEFEELEYEVMNMNEYELDFDMDGSFDEIDIAEDDMIDPFHEESPVFEKTIEDFMKDTPERRAEIEWIKNVECDSDIEGLPTDDERYDIEPDEPFPTDENGALLPGWDIDHGRDDEYNREFYNDHKQVEEEEDENERNDNVSYDEEDDGSKNDDGDDDPDGSDIKIKERQIDEDEVFEKQLEEITIQAEEQARKEAKESNNNIAMNSLKNDNNEANEIKSYKKVSLKSKIERNKKQTMVTDDDVHLDKTIEIHEASQVTKLQESPKQSKNKDGIFPSYEPVSPKNITKQEILYMKKNMTEEELNKYIKEAQKAIERSEERYKKFARKEAAQTAGKMFAIYKNVIYTSISKFDQRLGAVENENKNLRATFNTKMAVLENLDKNFNKSIEEMKKKNMRHER